MRRNWPFFKDSDWLILVFVHSAKPTAELENLAMSPLSSPGLSYDTKFVHIGWELRSSLVGDTILGVQSEPACNDFGPIRAPGNNDFWRPTTAELPRASGQGNQFPPSQRQAGEWKTHTKKMRTS